MSSVVNKSAKRFVPKLRERRQISSAQTSSAQKPVGPAGPGETPETVVSANKASEVENAEPSEASNQGEVEKSETQNENENESGKVLSGSAVETTGSGENQDNIGKNGGVTFEEDDPLSQTTMARDLGPSRTSTQIPVVAVSSTASRRRSSRLDSLSAAKPTFKSGFMGANPANGSVSGSVPEKSRRLSTISTGSLRKKSLSINSENDSSLQAIKRRRMSSRSSVGKGSGKVQRISIVSRMSSPDDDSLTAKPAGDAENTDDIFQRTDDLYQKYTIANLKMIPKKIADTDSSKYLIDEENFTMADLCKPTLPIGEISENFTRAKEAARLKAERRKKRRELRETARREFKSLNDLVTEEESKLKEERKKAAQELLNTEVPDEKPRQGIQLKMSADGSMVVDEESTVVDRHKNASLENSSKEKIQNNPFENLYNSATYGRQQFTDPWTTEEMIKFYQALSMWGTDFNLISQLFPYRTRRQIKSKFVNEEKKHPIMIELALRSKLPPNFDQYCQETRKTIGTVHEFNKRLDQLQVEHEEHLKQIEVERQNAREQDIKQQSVKEHERAQRGKQGGRQEQLREYRKSEIVLGSIDDLKKKRAEEVTEET
ncbi:transcription factor TFIIIB component B'' [Kluyveromyces marxianus DMKU3-1042]|uniref:Transcription factor TFIIIB component B n=1 Tax=Kluyveromyces marxianus (strain DMKU3-1042 / BCC 29191 / NBRC 104275) TaxID=1003335 RepID=W0TI08_KLUMD|nr:transcription factor TFIIIB component B'' [Kluyveromyces marxianus DMKU3-1042]BAO42446.1 transcription factor TFIIIB component B'' [Kluyveromyces marxianus DMKU3-1042]